MPALNIWTGLLSIVAVIGLVQATLVTLGKSRFTDGRIWLAIVLYAFSLILITYVMIWSDYVQVFPYLRFTWPTLTLLIGPSLYFYLRTIFNDDFSNRTICYHYLIPGIAFVLAIPFILVDFGVEISFRVDAWRVGSSGTLLCGHLLFYTVLIALMTRNEWQVDNNIRTWTRYVSSGMMVYTGAFYSYFILAGVSFFNPQWDYSISLVMALSILGIGYMGLIQKRVFRSEPIEKFLPAQKYKTSNLTASAGDSIKRNLDRLLHEQQVFKENELRLDDLAAYLDVNRHQLSQVINEHYKVNFFELINQYRIDYVKKLLADPTCAHYTIMQIAYEAGFNNKASFNRYFKKASGLTPSAFRIRETEFQTGADPQTR